MHYIFINVVIAKATEEIMHSLSEILSLMYEIFSDDLRQIRI